MTALERLAPGAPPVAGVIPLTVPELGGNEWAYIKECLDTGWVSSAGAFVERFELAVANAVGAAIAQISGEVDHTVTLGTRSRDEALAQAKALAVERAITAGAHPDTVQVIDVEEIPLTYLPSNALRMRVKRLLRHV